MFICMYVYMYVCVCMFFNFPNARYTDWLLFTYATNKSKSLKLYYKYYNMKVLTVSSSHKNSNKKGTNSVFHHFCPGLPVSLALCPIEQCGTLSQTVSIHGFAEAAQHAVGVGADSVAVTMFTQAFMPNAQSKFCNCFSFGQSGILAISCFHDFLDSFFSTSCLYTLWNPCFKCSLTFRHRASSIQDRRFSPLQRTLFMYLINKYISLSDICLTVHH